MTELSKKPLLLQLLDSEPIEEIPVWLMRQAGRYLPEYRALKEKYTFNQLSESPELAAEVTIQPLKRFSELDAAILFADILTPAKALGFDFEFNPGPVLSNPIKHPVDVEKLKRLDVTVTNKYVFDALKNVKNYLLSEERTQRRALLGFAATPWTLACYLIDQTPYKQHMGTKIFAYHDKERFSVLLKLIADVTIEYLTEKHKAGADAVQLFDTWASLLSNEEYHELSGQWIAYIIEALSKQDVPVILYTQGSQSIITQSIAYKPKAISVDWRTNLSEVRKLIPSSIALQGNMDPCFLFADAETIEKKTIQTYADLKNSRVIANLGHGILQKTPIDSVSHFLKTLKNL